MTTISVKNAFEPVLRLAIDLFRIALRCSGDNVQVGHDGVIAENEAAAQRNRLSMIVLDDDQHSRSERFLGDFRGWAAVCRHDGRQPSNECVRSHTWHKRLTRSRRENPVFNYRFFRPNPLVFGWLTWENEEHAPEVT